MQELHSGFKNIKYMATDAQVTGTWILIGLYAALILFFVIRGALKIKNLSDYAVGSINFKPWAVGLSLAASMTSAATFVVNPGFIANYGISGVISYAVVFPLGSMISLIVLTKSFRKYGESVKALTLAQWMGQRYKSKAYAFFMAVLSLLMITFLVLLVVAMTKVLSKSLNVSEIPVLAGIVIFVFGYMMFGGANSMVYTNTIQALIMLVVAFILLGSGYDHFRDGISGFLNELAAIDPVLVQKTNPGSLLFRNFYEIVFAQFIVGIAVVIQPHIITKSLLLKKESDVNQYLLVAVIVELIFFAVVFSGLYARLSMPDLMADGKLLSNDGIIPAYVVRRFTGSRLSVFIGLIVVLGLISAGLSTIEGLIQSLSSTFTNDIMKPLLKGKQDDNRIWVRINKGGIITVALITFFISRSQIFHPKFSVAILAQNGVYAYFAAAFVPVLFGIFARNVRKIIPVAASLTAILVHFSVYYLLPWLHNTKGVMFGKFTVFVDGAIRNPAIAASSAILASLLLGSVLYFSTRNKKESTVQ